MTSPVAPTRSQPQDGAPGGPERRVLVSETMIRAIGPDAHLTITPNRQAARSLGVPYVSLESLARKRLEMHGLQQASKFAVSRLLREAARLAGERRDPAGLADSAESTVRELLRAAVDPAGLAADASPRLVLLGQLLSAYLELLAGEGMVDPGSVLWRAAELDGDRLQVTVTGYPRLPRAECAFLDSLAADGSRLYLAAGADPILLENQASVGFLAERGWRIEDVAAGATTLGEELAQAWLGGPALPPEAREGRVRVYAYPDQEEEVRGTLAAIKRLLAAGVSAREIAVVARNEEEYGPRLLAVADEYGVPLRALYTVPFGETRVGSWLELLLTALQEGFPFEATARLLGSPLADRLPSGYWAQARLKRHQGGEEWAEALPQSALAWPESATLREHLTRLRRLIAEFGLRDAALSWAREADAFARYMDALNGIEELDRTTDLDGFAAALRELTSVLTVPAQPGRGGVELHSPLSLFGARVEHLFILGASEGTLPAPVRSDPHLDPFERERLSLAGADVEVVSAAASREELSFWALLQTVGSVLEISFPRLVGRQAMLPSPFLARLGSYPTRAPGRILCSWPELRRDALLAPGNHPDVAADEVTAGARRALGVEARRESAAPPDEFDGVTGRPYQPPRSGLAVSRLVDMASCPFKFYATRVLDLEEAREGSEELDSLARGSLYHDVLQRAFELALGGGVALGGTDLQEAVLTHLPEALDAAERESDMKRMPDWHLQRESHLVALRRAVQSPGFIAGDARVVALEAPFEAEWRGIPVRGRVDRVDETREGLTLVDYKLGSKVSQLAKDAAGNARIDLQLSVYREAAAPVLAPEREVSGTRYYSLSQAEAIAIGEAGEDELGRIAASVLESWRSGRFPVDPDLRGNACKYCSFGSLCRKGSRLERKRAA